MGKKIHFKDLKYKKKIMISKLVAEYNLFSLDVFPYTHCKARVWLESDGTYLALSNITIKDKSNNTVDGTSGRGSSEIEALDNLINNLLDLISNYEDTRGRKLQDEDYDYVDCDDF